MRLCSALEVCDLVNVAVSSHTNAGPLMKGGGVFGVCGGVFLFQQSRVLSV